MRLTNYLQCKWIKGCCLFQERYGSIAAENDDDDDKRECNIKKYWWLEGKKDNKKNKKTAGYHRYILRLLIFVKKAFKKMKMFFPEKTLSSS